MRSRLLVFIFALASLGCAADPPTRTHQPEADVSTIEANGVRFAYFADGDPSDPLVLLLHGFPDTAHAWDDLRPEIAEQGYYVVSPFMRGYAPSDALADADYDGETLGRDVLALIDAFGKPEAVVVGHDWGAVAAYSAAALDPSRVRKLVALVIPHPASLKIRLRDLRRVRHFLALRKRRAAKRVARDDYADIDELYARWSPTWAFTAADLEPVKNSFSAPGSLYAALGYYRDLKLGMPEEIEVPLQMPALVIAGLDDGTTPLDAFDDASMFAAGYQLEKLQAGHFPHRERPDEFLQLLLTFLGEGSAAAPADLDVDKAAPDDSEDLALFRTAPAAGVVRVASIGHEASGAGGSHVTVEVVCLFRGTGVSTIAYGGHGIWIADGEQIPFLPPGARIGSVYMAAIEPRVGDQDPWRLQTGEPPADAVALQLVSANTVADAEQQLGEILDLTSCTPP